MAISLIDKIKQKNSGTFKLVDAADVQYSDDDASVSIKDVVDGLKTNVSGIESIPTSDIDALS